MYECVSVCVCACGRGRIYHIQSIFEISSSQNFPTDTFTQSIPSVQFRRNKKRYYKLRQITFKAAIIILKRK